MIYAQEEQEYIPLSDPLSMIGAVSGGMSIAQSTYDFLSFIRGIANADVIAALFDEEGKRTEGNNKIEVTKIADGANPNVWWFHVKELDGYVFNRMPLTTSCVLEQAAFIDKQPHADYWRWYAAPQAGVMYVGSGSHPNIYVKFIVVGYKPKALLKYFTS